MLLKKLQKKIEKFIVESEPVNAKQSACSNLWTGSGYEQQRGTRHWPIWGLTAGVPILFIAKEVQWRVQRWNFETEWWQRTEIWVFFKKCSAPQRAEEFILIIQSIILSKSIRMMSIIMVIKLFCKFRLILVLILY